MNKNTLLVFLAASIALASGLFAQQFTATTVVPEHSSAVQFSLPDSSNKLRNVNEWKGKILIINFWATWCPPCLKEIPEFIKLQNEYKDKNVQFLGIAIEDKETVTEFLKTIDINYPILIAEDSGIALSHKMGNIINAVPFSVIINQKGQIVASKPGELKRDQVIELISPLI